MLIDSEKKKKRLEICNTCTMNMAGVCKKCGCVLVLKTMLKKEKCPLGKWNQDLDEDLKK